jgi:uncharacterized cupin superfamily protein
MSHSSTVATNLLVGNETTEAEDVQEMSQPKKTKPTKAEVKSLGIDRWGLWEEDPATFEKHQSSSETFYVLEGEAEVKTKDGNTVSFKEGDLVTIPEGVDCRWHVKRKLLCRGAAPDEEA